MEKIIDAIGRNWFGIAIIILILGGVIMGIIEAL